MKTILKYWWVVVLAGLAVYIFILNRKIDNLRETSELQAVELSMVHDSVRVFKSKSGELIYKLSVVSVSHSNLKESLEKAGIDIRKLKDDNINANKLVEFYRMRAQATGSVSVPLQDTFKIVELDTINYLKFDQWSNDFLILNNGNIINKQLDFNYKYLLHFEFYKEEYRKSTIISVKFSDPKAEVLSANSIVVYKENKWYEKPWLWGLAGLTTGILISK